MPKLIYAKEYEEYLITGKEEALNSLVHDSIEKKYFVLVRKLLTSELTKELQDEIDKFIKRIPSTQSYRIKALYIFKKLQLKNVPQTEIIKEIKNLFKLGELPTYTRPRKYNKVSQAKEEGDEQEKSGNLNNKLDLSVYEKLKKFSELIYSDKIDEDKIKEFVRDNEDMSKILELDFTKIKEKNLVNIFSNPKKYDMLSQVIVLSIPNADINYFKKIIKLVVKQVKNDKEAKKNF